MTVRSVSVSCVTVVSDMAEEKEKYESGIRGMAECRFGGKINIGRRKAGTADHPIHVVTLSESYETGEVGAFISSKPAHRPQVVLCFDSLQSLDMLRRTIDDVQEALKRDLEELELRSGHTGDENVQRRVPIAKLHLGVRVENGLRKAGIVYLDELLRVNRASLTKIRNFGNKSLYAIDDFFSKHGYQWGREDLEPVRNSRGLPTNTYKLRGKQDV